MYDAEKSYMALYYERAEGLGYGEELESIYTMYEMEFRKFVENMDIELVTAENVYEYRLRMLGKIRDNIDYIKNMKENGIQAVVLKPYEYEGALGKEQEENQKFLALCNILATIVISCGFISYEKSKEYVESYHLAMEENAGW